MALEDTQKKEQFLKKLEQIRTRINTFQRARIPHESIHDLEKNHRSFISTTNTLFNKPTTLGPMDYLPDLIKLLEDGLNHKLSGFLQEILNNAEFQASIQKKDSSDPSSRNILVLNLQIAATAIDKYASLLEACLNNPEAKAHEKEIQDVSQTLENSSDTVRRLSLTSQLLVLDTTVKNYIHDHQAFRFCCFNWCSNYSQNYRKLITWFNKLVDPQWKFSATQLAGAIYVIRSSIKDNYLNSKESAAVRDSLDSALKISGFPEYLTKIEKTTLKEYIDDFKKKVEDWPEEDRLPYPLKQGQSIFAINQDPGHKSFSFA